MAHPDVTQASEPQTPAELARKLFELLNERDLDAASTLWSDDLQEEFLVLRTFHGPQDARGFFEELFAAFPDFHLEVEAVIGDDQAAFVAWRAAGTFTGTPFQDIAANGAEITIRGVDHMRFRDGKLFHNTIYYDGAGFARAIGMLPSMGSMAENAMKGAFNAVTSLKRTLGR